MPTRHWAGVGAFLVIALLAVGLFTQDVIEERQEPTIVSSLDAVCSVALSNTYYDQWQPESTGATAGDQLPLLSMIASIDDGFTAPASDSDLDPQLKLTTCPTGNCTFDAYSTLAVCSKCVDVSESIECTDGSCAKGSRIQLPDGGLSLDPDTGFLNMTSDTSYSNISALSDTGPLIARHRGIGSVDSKTPPYAVECAVYWCVNTYTSAVTNGIFNETVTRSLTDASTTSQTTYGQTNNITIDQCQTSQSTMSDDSSSCLYEVDSLSQRALQNYLVRGSEINNKPGFLAGQVTTTNNSQSSGKTISSLAANAIISPCTIRSECTSSFYKLFEASVTSMAAHMTSNIRRTVDTGPGFASGTMMQSEAHFHVRWPWLVYPIVVVIITVIFVVVTVVRSRHTQPWKSSVTALIFHGLSDADRDAWRQLGNHKEMKDATETWNVVLDDRDGAPTFKRAGDDVENKDKLSMPTGFLASFRQAANEAMQNS